MNNGQYLAEVREALEHDNTRLGEVWRLTKEGKSATKIAEELGHKTPGFVHSNQRHIWAIEENVLPTGFTAASLCGNALRGFINRSRESLSEDTLQILKKRVEECFRLANESLSRER